MLSTIPRPAYLLPALRLFAVGVAALLLTGCGSFFKQPNPNKETFLLPSMGGLPDGEMSGDVGTVVAVRPFHIVRAYGDKSLVYRLSEVHVEQDYYNTWLVSPDAMITDRMREWLASSGAVGQVQTTGSLLKADYVVEGNVTELYGDYTGKTPAAVIELKLTVMPVAREASGGAILHKTYKATLPMADREPGTLVEALGNGLEVIFTDFGADLRKVL